jgi:hypothetical protein
LENLGLRIRRDAIDRAYLDRRHLAEVRAAKQHIAGHSRLLFNFFRLLLRVCVDAFDESTGIGVGPVGILRFEVCANLFPSIIGQYALAFERKRSRTDFGDQTQFRRKERTIPRSAMVR